MVDKLGSLQDAIDEAAKLAKVENYRIRSYPKYKKDLDDFKMNPFAKISKEDVLKEALGEANYRMYLNLNQMQKLKGIQARVPFIFEIK